MRMTKIINLPIKKRMEGKYYLVISRNIITSVVTCFLVGRPLILHSLRDAACVFVKLLLVIF